MSSGANVPHFLAPHFLAPHFLLDTNTVNYILKGRSAAARTRLATLPKQHSVGISIITEAGTPLWSGESRSFSCAVGGPRRVPVDGPPRPVGQCRRSGLRNSPAPPGTPRQASRQPRPSHRRPRDLTRRNSCNPRPCVPPRCHSSRHRRLGYRSLNPPSLIPPWNWSFRPVRTAVWQSRTRARMWAGPRSDPCVGEIEGRKAPTLVSMPGWPGPISHYHAANGQEHWITELMGGVVRVHRSQLRGHGTRFLRSNDASRIPICPVHSQIAACATLVSILSLSQKTGKKRPRAMAWNFRRSLNLGPLRFNAAKSGIGYSLGVRGFRVGKDAKGRKYTATSIPGTGIYRRAYLHNAAQANPPNPAPSPKLLQAGTGFHVPAWLVYLAVAILLYLIIRIIR